MVLQQRAEGLSQDEIAQRLGFSQPSISHVIAQFTATDALAKLWVRGRSLKLTKAGVLATLKAARKGDAEPALEMMDRLDVLPKRVEDAGAKVQIVIGAAAGALPDPTFLDVAVDGVSTANHLPSASED